jgi:methylated-DNA-[protein]-cysteine S-methyltransferase
MPPFSSWLCAPGVAVPAKHVYKTMQSPVGRLKLVASEGGLAAILWEHDNPRRVPLNLVAAGPDHLILLETENQLHEYFAGQRQAF